MATIVVTTCVSAHHFSHNPAHPVLFLKEILHVNIETDMPKPSVLIVEPDGFLAGIYGRKFEAEGWNVNIAEDLDDAKKTLQKKKIAAVLFEPIISHHEAIDFVQGVRNDVKTSQMPLVVLSELSERREIERMRAAGASAYLIKGHFVPSEAVQKVKALLVSSKI